MSISTTLLKMLNKPFKLQQNNATLFAYFASMRTFLLLLLLPSFAFAWIDVFEDEKMFMDDFENHMIVDGYYRFSLYINGDGEIRGGGSIKFNQELDCQNNRIRTYSKSLYDRPNLNGIVIAQTGTEEWRSPSPTSQMGKLTKNLCQLIKPE